MLGLWGKPVVKLHVFPFGGETDIREGPPKVHPVVLPNKYFGYTTLREPTNTPDFGRNERHKRQESSPTTMFFFLFRILFR